MPDQVRHDVEKKVYFGNTDTVSMRVVVDLEVIRGIHPKEIYSL